jgi:hypothetical protein
MKISIKSVLLSCAIIASLSVLAGPGWNRVNYTNSTIFTGVVTVNGVPADSGDVIGIFVNGECRMISTVFTLNGTSYVSAVLHGEKTETATIKYWNAKQDKIYDIDTTIATSPSNEILLFPISLKSSEVSTESKTISTSNTLSIYPTITKNTISISSSNEIKSIHIINNIGNVILKISDPVTTKIDVSSFSTGLYFISVNFKDGSTITKKIIKN